MAEATEARFIDKIWVMLEKLLLQKSEFFLFLVQMAMIDHCTHFNIS